MATVKMREDNVWTNFSWVLYISWKVHPRHHLNQIWCLYHQLNDYTTGVIELPLGVQVGKPLRKYHFLGEMKKPPLSSMQPEWLFQIFRWHFSHKGGMDNLKIGSVWVGFLIPATCHLVKCKNFTENADMVWIFGLRWALNLHQNQW